MDYKTYDISILNIRVIVYFDTKQSYLIGYGKIEKMSVHEDCAMCVHTVRMDNGELLSSAGLTIKML